MHRKAEWVGRLIESDADLAEGAAFLQRREPRFAGAFEAVGPLPLRRNPAGFASLLDAIISQQVSVASASAIWRRLEAAKLTDSQRVAAASEDDLRRCGLSRQKIRYVQGLAAANLDFDALSGVTDEVAISTLMALPGVGRWTAEIYAMFSLGRADVFASGDLALQEAARLLFDLPQRPSEAEMRDIARAWSPWRAVAARALWAYYRVCKNREGIT